MAAVGQFVKWDDNRADFDRIVEALIYEIWSSTSKYECQVIDGRGGDGGRDIYVKRDGVTVHIYQLKFFPGGMSGGWSKRRGQVKKSFDAIKDVKGLETWTLVIPGNPTIEEEAFVSNLRQGRKFGVRIMGRAKLDQEISKRGQLLTWATRDPTRDWLVAASHEKAALNSPEDYSDRLRDLVALADAQSPYWGWTTVVDGLKVQRTLFAKRPDASQREPISIDLVPKFEEGYEALRVEYLNGIEFGSVTTLRLPPEVVERFVVNGPDWIAQEHEHVEVEIRPASLSAPLSVEIRAVDGDGELRTSLQGKVAIFSPGSKGSSMHAEFGPLTLTFRLPKQGDRGGVDISYDVIGVRAQEASRLFRFLTYMEGGAAIEFRADNQLLFKTAGQVERSSDETVVNPKLLALVEDLAVLEREFDVDLLIPGNVSGAERLDIRVARMLVEGRATVWPRVRSLDAPLSGQMDEGLRELLTSPKAVYARYAPHVMTILDRPLTVGTLGVYHGSMEVANSTAILQKLEAGKGEGEKVSLTPTDGLPIRIFLTEKWSDDTRHIVPEPWGVDGIAEHPGLNKLLDAVDGADSGRGDASAKVTTTPEGRRQANE